MPTTAELRLLHDRQYGYIVLVDGIRYGFADHRDLAHMTPAGHVVRLGLTRKGLRHDTTIDLRTGQFHDDPWSFTVEDLVGDLARLFAVADDSMRQLGDVPLGAGLPIAPSEHLGARTDLHAKNVGTERIGPSGERHLWPAPVDFTIGHQHAITVPGVPGAGAPVSDNPIVWNGRRVVLYRCFRDHVTYPDPDAGIVSWRPFVEAEIAAFGRLRDEGRQQGRRWTFRADGKGSWLREPLMPRMQREPVFVDATITLSTTDGARTDGIGVALSYVSAVGSSAVFGERIFAAPIVASSHDEIRDAVLAEIAAAAAATGVDGVWEDVAGRVAAMELDGSIRIGVPSSADVAGLMMVCLHRIVWSALGYQLEEQAALYPDPDDPRAVQFSPVGNVGAFASEVTGPDYWVGYFWTHAGGEVLDNNGHVRIYEPKYKGGTTVLLADLNAGAGQVVRLADTGLGGSTSSTSVAHPGQLARPVASDPSNPLAPIEIDGVPCDRTGLWLFFGKRRFEGTEEEFDEYWVGEACWRNGAAQQDGLVSGDTIVVVRWLNRGRFGFASAHELGGDWVARASVIDPDAGMIRAVPFAVLAHADGSSYDQAHIVMQRMLLTTGTSPGWSSFAGDPGATLTPGGNEPSGDHTVVRDAEIADLGLGIPADLVHTPEAWRDVAARVEQDELLRCKLALSGGHSSADALRALMAPLGWCWHFRDGRFGIWCPADPLTLEDATVALTRASGKARAVEQHGERPPLETELRLFQPIDEFRLDYSWAPHLNRTTQRLEFVSPDDGLRYRPGGIEETIPAHSVRDPAGFGERAAFLAAFWARRHFPVRGYPVHLINPGGDCRVGTVVRLTDPEIADPAGEYGVSNRLAIVFGEHEDYERGSKTIDLLVLADRTNLPRLHGPIAQALAYDSATGRLYCADNFLGLEVEGWADVRQFTEPTYDGIAPFGGETWIRGQQWDGTDTIGSANNFLARVTSVNYDTPGSHYLVINNLSGTIWRDMDCIVTLLENSSANVDPDDWPQQLYGVVCDEAGEYEDNTATFGPGFPWEP